MKTLYAAASVVLALCAPLPAQEFSGEMAQARLLIREAREGRAWQTTHRNGILQQVDAALAHLAAEVKPSVVLLTNGEGSGSGFVVDAAGLVATNAHVAGMAGYRGKLKVVFPDGSEHEGTVVAIGSPGEEGDPMTGRDLALVRIDSAGGRRFLAAELGDSGLIKEGHMAAAMGYPLEQPFTMTQGTISGLDGREGLKVKFVQTDAAFNPGNSGGPLLSMGGKVVGVNTFILSRSGGSDGIGYAVRVEAVKEFLAQYRAKGPFDEGRGGRAPRRGAPRRPRGLAPMAAACPAPEGLSRPWVEQEGALPAAVLARHQAAPLDAAAPALLPVGAVSWWMGASRRGRGEPEEPGCFTLGSAAVYVYGREDAPELDFVKAVTEGGEAALAPRLIELRWYDEASGRKQRWYNAALARSLGWTTDGRGAPAETSRPIPLPDAVNELL